MPGYFYSVIKPYRLFLPQEKPAVFVKIAPCKEIHFLAGGEVFFGGSFAP